MQEKTLIQRAAKGDLDAFEELARLYEKKIFALCLRYTCHRQDAEDVAQTTLLKLYRTLPQFAFRSSFATWVYQVTKNTCLDYLRVKKRRQEHLSLEITENVIEDENTANPEGQWIDKEAVLELRRFIERLPEEQRAVLVLRDVDGYHYQEIAEILGVTEGTVKSRLSRARLKVKTWLFEEYNYKKRLQ